ncbi:MAG TPA: hypothetical protein O0X48_03720 [Methanocorpusculum sp.]|jgi:hypothetical protein|nr:hypothetical protein [Methanocorpusculum sp.]
MEYIVYESNTGFTKQYAEMLSEAVGLPALPMVQAVSKVPRGTEIFFLGWVCGGKITGLPVASKRFIVEGAAAVGIVYPHPDVIAELSKVNKLSCPLFYLQGGVDPKKLGYFKRKILSMIAQNLEHQENKTAAIWDLADTLRIGGSYVSGANLEPVVSWMKGSEGKEELSD